MAHQIPEQWIFSAIDKESHFCFLKYLFNKFKKDGLLPPVMLLHKAAKRGSEKKLGFLIKKGCGFNEEDHSGTKPLALAAEGGHIDCVALLLSHGAVLNDMQTENPSLIVAVDQGRVDVVEYLIAHGADVNIEDGGDASSLSYAVVRNNVKMVRALLSSPLIDLTHPSIAFYDSTNPEIIKLISEQKAKRLL